MNIDPSTQLKALTAALPSAFDVLKTMRISEDARDSRTLEQACTAAGIPLAQFLEKLDEIDWDREPE